MTINLDTASLDALLAALRPGRHVTAGTPSGRGVVLTTRGSEVRVMDAASGVPAWFPAREVVTRRGRPALVSDTGLCRWDVDALIASDNSFVFDAITLLFGRQTDDEQVSATTRHDNDLGFRADHARKGTILAALAPDAWGEREFVIAREVLSWYSGTQLYDLAAEYLSR